ncbi:6762_t:CDS:2, partial [Ambispora gerdemannii]
DLKFAENRYKINVELSVVTDKTVMTGKTTEKFTRTTVNNEREENKQEESKQEENKPEENKQEENEGGDVIVDESSVSKIRLW